MNTTNRRTKFNIGDRLTEYRQLQDVPVGTIGEYKVTARFAGKPGIAAIKSLGRERVISGTERDNDSDRVLAAGLNSFTILAIPGVPMNGSQVQSLPENTEVVYRRRYVGARGGFDPNDPSTWEGSEDRKQTVPNTSSGQYGVFYLAGTEPPMPTVQPTYNGYKVGDRIFSNYLHQIPVGSQVTYNHFGCTCMVVDHTPGDVRKLQSLSGAYFTGNADDCLGGLTILSFPDLPPPSDGSEPAHKVSTPTLPATLQPARKMARKLPANTIFKQNGGTYLRLSNGLSKVIDTSKGLALAWISKATAETKLNAAFDEIVGTMTLPTIEV